MSAINPPAVSCCHHALLLSRSILSVPATGVLPKNATPQHSSQARAFLYFYVVGSRYTHQGGLLPPHKPALKCLFYLIMNLYGRGPRPSSFAIQASPLILFLSLRITDPESVDNGPIYHPAAAGLLG